MTGVTPKVSEDAFEDLLGNHTFHSSKSNQPKTIKDMRREQEVLETDPDKLKVELNFEQYMHSCLRVYV